TAEPSPPPASGPTGATGATGVPAPSDDVVTEEVSFPGPASDILGYLARPAGDALFPGVLVIHENRGLLPHFEDVARRYAAEGFVAFAIDMASRLGGSDVAAAQLGQIPPEELVQDLQAAIDYLKEHEHVSPEAIGVTGF